MAKHEFSKTLKSGIGAKVKLYRKSKGLTQEKLAELADSTPQTLSGIENGKNFPSFTLLSKIIEVLDIAPYQLFMFDNSKIDTKSKEFDIVLKEKFKNTTFEQRKLIYALIDAVIENC